MPAGIERRVAKDGSISYRVRIQRRGQPLLTATFRRQTDALEWQRQQQAALLTARHLPHRAATVRTLREALERYVADVLPHKRPATQAAQRSQVAWWQTGYGQLTLAQLTPQVLVQARDTLARTHAPGTVNRYLALLSHVLTLAVREWAWLAQHPMQQVRRLREPRGRVRFLDQSELQRLLAACRASHGQYLYAVVLLALSTGGRKSELLGLRWRDVDVERGAVTFQQTKNQERRTVPVRGEALQVLRALAQAGGSARDYVFPGESLDRPRDIREAWEVARRKAGIQDFRFHDLRHTAASYLAMSGASLIEIAEILGHKTMQIVKRYTHLTPQHTAQLLERMAAQFLQPPGAGE